MSKLLNSKSIIFIFTFLYCTILAMICTNNFLNIKLLGINFIMFVVTLFIKALISGVFLFSIDAFLSNKKDFKLRFFEIVKSLLIAYLILLPFSLITLILNFLVDFQMDFFIRVISFSINFICPISLFFSYKFVTKSTWEYTIKVNSITVIIITLFTQLFKLI